MLQRFVYIASAGHSGSTLLSLLLHSFPQVSSVGRVASLAEYAADSTMRCMCGKPVSNCPFWQRVERELRTVRDDPELRLESLPIRLVRPRRDMVRLTPMTVDPVLLLGNRRIWRWTATAMAPIRRTRQAGETSLDVFEVVARLNGTPIIVDASNNSVRMKYLYLTDPQRFCMIHLVRDGRAVAYSQMRREHVPMDFAARVWRRKQRNLSAMMFTIPRSKICFLRYEDLCTDVAGVSRRLGRFLDLGDAAPEMTIQREEVHNISGNPMRFRKDESRLQLDNRWRAGLSPAELATFDRIAGRINRRNGYE